MVGLQEEHARAVTHDLEATQFELQSCRVSIDEKEEDLRSSALHIRKLTHEKALVLGELNGTKLAKDALQTQVIMSCGSASRSRSRPPTRLLLRATWWS